MAKLRTNHGKARSGGSFGASLRPLYTLIAVLLIVGLALWPRLREKLEGISVGQQVVTSTTSSGTASGETADDAALDLGDRRLYLPVGPSDQIIHHQFFSLGYDNAWEQPRWVAYILTAAQVRAKGLPRSDDFRPDPAVRDGSAEREDYRGSGFTRGHLVPSGDFNFDAQAMSETFLLSNISPQRAEHNGGVWRELEETTRDWTVRYGALYIVTGPIVAEPNHPSIGKNHVAVPQAFYKVLLSEKGGAIGFVIPHEMQTAPLEAFAKTVDEVEALTGLDFFPELTELAPPEIEATYQLRLWPTDQKRYQRRLNQWNPSSAPKLLHD